MTPKARQRRGGGSARSRRRTPTEDDIQIKAVAMLADEHPHAWSRIFHVVNEQPQSRTPTERHRAMLRGKKMKAMGRKPGVPDLMLPIARGGYFGLAIEVKTATGTMRPEQKQWKLGLESEGWQHAVCRTPENIVETVLGYMRQRPTVGEIEGTVDCERDKGTR